MDDYVTSRRMVEALARRLQKSLPLAGSNAPSTLSLYDPGARRSWATGFGRDRRRSQRCKLLWLTWELRRKGIRTMCKVANHQTKLRQDAERTAALLARRDRLRQAAAVVVNLSQESRRYCPFLSGLIS